MIRYSIDHDTVVQLVDEHKSSWRTRASERTRGFIEVGKFNEESSIWSEIKPVFMDIQFNKCVFCERKLGDDNFSRVEHDLEHFRPKGRVTKWPRRGSAVSFSFELGETSARGYFWLAYDLKNYAAACKTCNSSLKSDAFPIAGARGVAASDVDALKTLEKPFLCYPIGVLDDDPETLIDFVGTVARPARARGHKRRRAEVIIEFFKLNSRDELHFERASAISLVGVALEKIERNEQVERFQRLLLGAQADNQPHASCKRAFVKLWDDDRPLAKQLLEGAQELTFTMNVAAEDAIV